MGTVAWKEGGASSILRRVDVREEEGVSIIFTGLLRGSLDLRVLLSSLKVWAAEEAAEEASFEAWN